MIDTFLKYMALANVEDNIYTADILAELVEDVYGVRN